MELSKYKNIGVSLVIGIIGSALWSFLSETLAPRITAYFIGISNSFSQKVFIEISTHDLTTLQQSTYSLLSFILIFVVGGMCASAYLWMLKAKERFQKIKVQADDLGTKFSLIEDKGNSLEINHEDAVIWYKNIRSDLEKTDKTLKQTHRITSIFLSSSFVILVVASFYSLTTYKYINESIVYFDYLLKVNAVNLNDQSEREYLSRFTQIRNSKDYKAIIVELEKLALDNQQSILPNLTVRSKSDISKDHPDSKPMLLDDFKNQE